VISIAARAPDWPCREPIRGWASSALAAFRSGTTV